MRLTCPNCSARYEVDDSLVPPEGRDVQCSNCSTTWFQPGIHIQIELAEPEPVETPESTEPEPPVTPERRALDPALRDILNEERDREAALRNPEATQEEMPLEAPEERPAENETNTPSDEETLSAIRAAAASGAVAASVATVADSANDGDAAQNRIGRELLPDIDEISSTLRATTDRDAGDYSGTDIDTSDTRPRRRRGFRIGFLLAMCLTGLAIAAYAFAPEIEAQLPQAGPYLGRYTAQVDELRFLLDDQMRLLTEWLQSTMSGDE